MFRKLTFPESVQQMCYWEQFWVVVFLPRAQVIRNRANWYKLLLCVKINFTKTTESQGNMTDLVPQYPDFKSQLYQS